MNYDNIKDYRLHKFLKKAIVSAGKGFVLRTLTHCAEVSVNPAAGVAILSNSRYSRLFGARMCKNSWACPICSAVQSSRYAARIAAALDALKDKYNAIMITFTIFHSKQDSCQQAFDLLFETWKRFADKGTGERNGGLSTFLHDLNIKHRVRCAEVTYSENGWHPHFHCLFWVPKSKFASVLSYEEKLVESWRTCQEKTMKKVYGYTKYNAFYESEKLHPSQRGVFISKVNNKPIIQKSSDYLCGWGADNEAVGNYLKQASSKNSRTPYQLLQAGYDGDQKAIQLYLEFAEYVITHKRRRFDFSRTGINAIVQNYINSSEYREVMKKKFIQFRADGAKWHLVSWFSNEQWRALCRTDSQLDFSLLTLILCLAKYSNGHEMINEVLTLHNLPISLNYDPLGYVNSLIEILNGEREQPIKRRNLEIEKMLSA